MDFDFNKMKYACPTNDGGLIEMDKAYEITSPWCLGWTKYYYEKYGVQTSETMNCVYTPPVIGDSDFCKSLLMDYDEPFWELEGKDWKMFKVRIVKFSEYKKKLATINGEGLEDLKKRITGEWQNE